MLFSTDTRLVGLYLMHSNAEKSRAKDSSGSIFEMLPCDFIFPEDMLEEAR